MYCDQCGRELIPVSENEVYQWKVVESCLYCLECAEEF